MELGNWAFGNSRGEYPVDRAWQDDFCERLYEMGFDSYGLPRKHPSPLDNLEAEVIGKDGSFYRYENEVFAIMSYFWGDDDVIERLPNFVYKPTGFELSWYKYALRDSYMNQDVSFAQLDEMLRKCCESLKAEVNV